MALIVTITALATAAADAQGKRSRGRAAVLKMQVTAYCVDGETAGGTEARRGVVAADPRVLPLGSRIRIEGLDGRRHNRTYRVEDTGPAVKGRVIDIFMDSCQAAKEFGRQTARVRVLERGTGEVDPP